MNITIFGATTALGKKVVQQALMFGHNVTAYGRNVFTADFKDDENLKVYPGTLFDQDGVLQALKNADAVVSVLSGGTDGVDKSRSLGMKNIVSQMQKAGVKRIISLSGSEILTDPETNEPEMENSEFPPHLVPLAKEHLASLETLEDTDLSWTVVGAPEIIEGDPTGMYGVEPDHMPQGRKRRISTGDLALFMLEELKHNRYIQKKVGISN